MIYIHIPFCRSFCIYCDFFSEISADGPVQAFTEAVCSEIRRRKDEIQDSPKTLYFGGGTPSQLPLSCLTRILLTLEECGHGGPYTEFTYECNPEDIVQKGLPYVQSLKTLGVNRISIGVQSFDDGMLRWMNRPHTAETAREAYRIVREAGIQNVSLDLIFGLSNLSDGTWDATVDEALALEPEHISCYQLTLDGESRLRELLDAGEYDEAPEEVCRRQYYSLCRKAAEKGYVHYEISNFAKPGFEAAHNSGYWQQMPYVGLGAAAHSYDRKSRSWNIAHLEQYIRAINNGQRPCQQEQIDEQTAFNDLIVTALRTREGIDLGKLSEPYSSYLLAQSEPMRERGLLQLTDNRLHLTRQGLFISDDIMTRLISIDHEKDDQPRV